MRVGVIAMMRTPIELNPHWRLFGILECGASQSIGRAELAEAPT